MAQVQQVPRPVRVAFDVAEHDRRRGRQAGAMRLRDAVQPLLRAELVGCELVADLVLEDFCVSARQRAEAGAPPFSQKFVNDKTVLMSFAVRCADSAGVSTFVNKW